MKIAGVQMDLTLGEVDRNLDRALAKLRETRDAGAELTIFPECAVTGYCFDGLDEARPFAQPIPGPATERFRAACSELGGYAVFGMLEAEGNRVFNAAVLVGGEGVLGTYRKVHLPYLGVDMFVDYGDRPFAVHAAGEVNVGLEICYDAAFPEAGRAHGILGADLVALPTNWPPGAECVAEHAINTRAMENGMYFAAVNRIGRERDFTFIGKSRICAPTGKTLASAEGTEEVILYADVDPSRARVKRVDRVPGKHAIDRLADRRPEMYDVLTRPHELPRPRDEQRG